MKAFKTRVSTEYEPLGQKNLLYWRNGALKIRVGREIFFLFV